MPNSIYISFFYQFRIVFYVFGDFKVISGFWAHFMAIFAFFRKSDKIGKTVLKFAKMDPSQKNF